MGFVIAWRVYQARKGVPCTKNPRYVTAAKAPVPMLTNSVREVESLGTEGRSGVQTCRNGGLELTPPPHR